MIALLHGAQSLSSLKFHDERRGLQQAAASLSDPPKTFWKSQLEISICFFRTIQNAEREDFPCKSDCGTGSFRSERYAQTLRNAAFTDLLDMQTSTQRKTENMRVRAGEKKGPARMKTLARSITKKSGGFCNFFPVGSVVLTEA